MTPRSLVVPEGASESERAQILPALVTAVNPDSAAYSRLTPEQRAYRYLVSGLTRQNSSAAETRSADGHLKYGAAANAGAPGHSSGRRRFAATLAEGAAAYTLESGLPGEHALSLCRSGAHHRGKQHRRAYPGDAAVYH